MDILLEIISPEKVLVHRMVRSVELPGTLGRFEVLHDHAPLISSLRIASGFVEVCENHVIACVEPCA